MTVGLLVLLVAQRWIAGLFAHQYPELVRRYAWLAQAGMNPNAPMNSATFRLPTRENLEKLQTF